MISIINSANTIKELEAIERFVACIGADNIQLCEDILSSDRMCKHETPGFIRMMITIQAQRKANTLHFN